MNLTHTDPNCPRIEGCLRSLGADRCCDDGTCDNQIPAYPPVDPDPTGWEILRDAIEDGALDAEEATLMAHGYACAKTRDGRQIAIAARGGWTYWNLRGKLDVPKERWVSYPGLHTQASPSPLYAWAGWNHLQQAQALAALYVERKDRDGWKGPELAPILAGLQELVPWLKQWHNDLDPTFDLRLGDYFADYVEEERRAHSLTVEDIEKVRLG